MSEKLWEIVLSKPISLVWTGINNIIIRLHMTWLFVFSQRMFGCHPDSNQKSLQSISKRGTFEIYSVSVHHIAMVELWHKMR